MLSFLRSTKRPPNLVFSSPSLLVYIHTVSFHTYIYIIYMIPGQITIIPKPELFGHFEGKTSLSSTIWGDRSRRKKVAS